MDPVGLIEQFQTLQCSVGEVLPDEHPQVDTAQVVLQFVGRPAFATKDGRPKVYVTFLSPAIAAQLGPGIAELGLGLGGSHEERPSGLVTATAGDMKHAAAAADMATRMREGQRG